MVQPSRLPPQLAADTTIADTCDRTKAIAGRQRQAPGRPDFSSRREASQSNSNARRRRLENCDANRITRSPSLTGAGHRTDPLPDREESYAEGSSGPGAPGHHGRGGAGAELRAAREMVP